jgi:hypothetical protein
MVCFVQVPIKKNVPPAGYHGPVFDIFVGGGCGVGRWRGRLFLGVLWFDGPNPTLGALRSSLPQALMSMGTLFKRLLGHLQTVSPYLSFSR